MPHGENGAKDETAWLSLVSRIQPDGVAMLVPEGSTELPTDAANGVYKLTPTVTT